MQLTPNGRLLIYNNSQTYLSCIEQPNVQGPACNFQDTCIDLSNVTNYLDGRGFTNFVAGIFNPSYQILHQNTCLGDSTLFTLNDTMGLDSISWQFGEPSSGPANTSSQIYPTHQYSSPGSYAVQAIAHYECTTDTLKDTISIPSPLQLDLGSDTSLCPQGGSFSLNAAQQDTNATYLWQDGSTDSAFTVNSSGTYWVRVANRCDTLSDTIHVAALAAPKVKLGQDTAICRDDQLVLNAGNPSATHLWQDSSTDSTLPVDSAGAYHVAVSNKCGTARDTIVVQQERKPQVELGPDTNICRGSPVKLTAHVSGSNSYIWRNGSTDSVRLVSREGKYILTAANTCGTASDTVAVSVHQPRPIELQPDTAICQSDTLLLDAGPAASYRWQDGSVGRHHQVTEAGTYSVSITGAYNCSNTDSVRVTARGCAGELFIPNAFTPNNDELNDGFRVYGENVQSLHIRIFNRWGELVFESRSSSSSWNGTYKGQPATEGVYIYVVKARFNDNSRVTRKGSLTLMR
jgi:gliding motility-associated-like protein